ncbi:hypothetical protein PVAP13_1NG392819 [Panicum virgatum]|uniref:Uncharacterized protein n=1 Tax=Panicum virgatum TaxID=38727 RepID=A0A8T0X0C2_PANVG|nr:hypothetical protein PVAP13_1NG392819 [Panicum virgatum]
MQTFLRNRYEQPRRRGRDGGAEAHAAVDVPVRGGDVPGTAGRGGGRRPPLALPPPVQALHLRRPRRHDGVQLHGRRRARGRLRPHPALLQPERARQRDLPLARRRGVVQRHVPRGGPRAGVRPAAGGRHAGRRRGAGGAGRLDAAAGRPGGHQEGAHRREADGGRARRRQGAVPVRRREDAQVHRARQLPGGDHCLRVADLLPPGPLQRAHLSCATLRDMHASRIGLVCGLTDLIARRSLLSCYDYLGLLYISFFTCILCCKLFFVDLGKELLKM